MQPALSSQLCVGVSSQPMDYQCLKNPLPRVLLGSLLLLLIFWLSGLSKWPSYLSHGLRKSTMLTLKSMLLTLFFSALVLFSKCQLNPTLWMSLRHEGHCLIQYDVIVERVIVEPEFKSWLCSLLAVWPWRSCLTFLCISFLICKLETTWACSNICNWQSTSFWNTWRTPACP